MASSGLSDAVMSGKCSCCAVPPKVRIFSNASMPGSAVIPKTTTCRKVSSVAAQNRPGARPKSSGASLRIMPRYSEDWNAGAVTSATQAILLDAYSSSDKRYAGLMLTKTSPICSVANCVRTHSNRLGDQILTRSPLVSAITRKLLASSSTARRNRNIAAGCLGRDRSPHPVRHKLIPLCAAIVGSRHIPAPDV